VTTYDDSARKSAKRGTEQSRTLELDGVYGVGCDAAQSIDCDEIPSGARERG
jgi:hypothetical protein